MPGGDVGLRVAALFAGRVVFAKSWASVPECSQTRGVPSRALQGGVTGTALATCVEWCLTRHSR